MNFIEGAFVAGTSQSFGIKFKLGIIVTGAIMLMLVVITAVCLTRFQKEMKHAAIDDQETRIKVFWSLLKAKGEEFSIQDGKLMAGSYVINGNYELPDKVKEICGGTATIFMQDTRVSTNVTKDDGSRAVGTKLTGVAFDAIFKGNTSYRGEAKILGEQYFTAYDPIRDRSGAIIGVLYTGVKKSEFFAAYDRFKINILVISIVFAVAICILLHFLVSWVITNPLSSVVRSIRDMKCDLTKRLDTSRNDEIGELAEWFNQFVEDMEGIISKVKKTTLGVEGATDEVAAGTQGLTQTTQENAAAIEEVAATIEQITASIKNNAQNADKGRDMTQEMVGMATTSGDSSKELMEAMGEISSASMKVGDIITTVNEVAFQTNLLALNAAVEAARAGEHGKGFAVVAEEVRALAQRSAEASNQIKHLINDTVQKVRAGDEIVKRSVESLGEIISRIDILSQTMDEVAAASSEQSTGVDEVNRALSQIDSTTQQNASTVEELANTSASLRDEARDLAALVEQFTVSGEGKRERRQGKAPVQEHVPVSRFVAPVRAARPEASRKAAPMAGAGMVHSDFPEKGLEDFEEF